MSQSCSFGVACDIFRSPKFGQFDSTINQRWLYELLSPAILDAGAQIYELSPPRIFSQYNNNTCLGGASGWIKAHSGVDDSAYLDEIFSYLLQCDIVIGFELSPNQKKFLCKSNRSYIDLSIDPVRFARDLYLRAYTNDNALRNHLLSFSPDKFEPLEDLAALRARISRHEDRSAETVPATLFVAQMSLDASRIVDGNLESIENHVGSINKTMDQTELLLIKPHPLEHLAPDVEHVHAVFPAAQIAVENIYNLLHNRSVTKVVSLSSGVLEEARLFGKETVELLSPRAGLGSRTGDLAPVRCNSRLLSSAAWKPIAGLTGTSRGLKRFNPIPSRDGVLRRALGLSWGYDPDVLPTYPLRLTIGRRVTADLTGSLPGPASYGWHPSEADGAWTIWKFATLSLDIECGCAVVACLELLLFSMPGANPIKVFVEGRSVGHAPTVVIVDGAERLLWNVDIHLKASPSRRHELAFRIQDPIKPSDYGPSGDNRLLGVKLLAVTLRSVNG